MGEGKPNITPTTTAPASVTAPAGSRADGVSEGVNTNFGPVLTEVPHAEAVPAQPTEIGAASTAENPITKNPVTENAEK